MIKKYNSYKASNLADIGVIPTHWEVKKLKYIASEEANSFVDGPFGSDLKNEEYVDEGVPLIQLNNIGLGVHKLNKLKYITDEKAKALARHKIYPNDIVIAKMAEPVARASVVNDDYPLYVIVADCVRLKPNGEIALPRFIAYMMNTSFIKAQAEIVSTGSTRIRVNLSDVKNLQAVFPPLNEQAAIVSFLDDKTTQIESLIQKKQRLIALFEEEKIAVINEAVTKGLNPVAPMKGSGIEWLGDVPAHWEVKKLKHVVSKVGSGVTPKGGAEVYQSSGIPFFRSQNIYFDGFRLDDIACISAEIDEDMKNTRIEVGDVLLNITGASIGRCYYADSSFGGGNVNQHVCIIRPIPNFITTPFLYYLIRSEVGQLQIDLQQTGANREGLNFEQLKNFILPVPSLDEQNQIVQELHREIERRNNTIIRVKNEIQLMQEYRIALISEAVTGKIDVRDYHPEPITSTALA